MNTAIRNWLFHAAWLAFASAAMLSALWLDTARIGGSPAGSSGLQAAPVGMIGGDAGRFAFSPDGTVLAGVDAGGRLALWDVVAGRTLRVLPGHFGDTVQDLVLSPNAATLASLGQGSVQLWDTGEGLARSSLPLPASNAPGRLLFSLDGAKLAIVSESGTVTLWDTRDGSVRQIQTGPLGSVGAVVFSPDGAELASGGKDGQITIWNTVTGRLESAHPAQAGIPISDLIATADGETLAGRGENAAITLWNPRTGVSHQFFASKQTADASPMAFSPDGAALANVDAEGQIAIRDAATGQLRLTIPGEVGVGVGGLVFSRNGGYLASVGSDGAIRLWDPVLGQLLRLLPGQHGAITRVAFSSDANYLTSVAKNGDVMVWDLASGSQVHAFNASGSDSVGAVASSGSAVGNISTASPGAEVSASAAREQGSVTAQAGTMPQAAKPSRIRPNHEKRSPHDWKGIVALAISPDGRSIGVAEEDGTVRILDARFNPRIGGKAHHGRPASAVVFSATGRDLISSGRDSAVYSWDSVNGQKSLNLLGLEHASRAVAASPDGKFIAGGGEETRVMLWDAASGKLNKIFFGSTDFVNALAFSPDGQLLAAGGADARIQVWDVPTGTLLKTLLGHSDAVNSLMFSPDGSRLASGGDDSSIRLWDVAAGRQIYNLQGHQAAVRAVVFSGDGKSVFSAGEDSRILAWNATTGQLSRQITGLSSILNALVITRDGNVIVGGGDRRLSEWDPRSGRRLLNGLLPLNTPAKTSPANTSTLDKLSSATGSGEASVTASKFEGGFFGGSGGSLSASAAGVVEQLLNWLIPAAEAAIPAPPGGPILVVTSPASPYSNYYAEILRAEGLNEYALGELGSVTAATLAAYDLVVLPPMSLTTAQVSMFSNWVNGGGNLIAMRPDPQLAGLLGLTSTGTNLSNAYLSVDTSAAPGNGIVGQTIQFHGTADRYTLNGAASIASLYSDATTATSNPAVTLRSVGSGKAAAFAYDLATSIVYTRQGNPAWAGQERDRWDGIGSPPIRSDDMFYGNNVGAAPDVPSDVQPDWVDLTNEVAIPQADEQLRLLTNLIVNMNLAKKPLPRFWYFPNGKKAVVVMTGDDHANGGTAGRFNQFLAASPAGCSVSNWECVRGTSYIYPSTPFTKAQYDSYTAQGFEVGLHLNTQCADYTPATLEDDYTQQIQQWTATYLGATSSNMPSGSTQRHHCLVWSDWVTAAKTQLARGMRLDVSYYFWPPGWVDDRPGHFTGSALPIRFADLDGTVIDVYNVPTQMTDESGQSYPFTIDTLLNRAVGPEGYYGVYTVNAHTDFASNPVSDAVVSSAQSRGVPIISSTQLLTWLDARGNSSFGSLAFANNALTFSIAADSAANGLQALVPLRLGNGAAITGITRGGAAVTYASETIKGKDYARFLGTTGAYSVVYGAADTTPPAVTATSPAAGASQVSSGTKVTATFSEAMDPATISSSTFELRDGGGALMSSSVTYDAATRTVSLKPSSSLSFAATYAAKVKGGATGVKDLAGNPLAADFPWSFTTEAQPCAGTPCSAWNSSTVPGTPSVNDPNSVELGVKFRSDLDGQITGIRFYQTHTGTYPATLWSAGGQQLATGSVTATAGGWQQLTFPSPVAITANTVYLASYHAPNGNYAVDNGYFANKGVDNDPIHLLQDGVSGGNGVYAYSASTTFPNSNYQSSNYWVDVIFTINTGPDTTPPTAAPGSPASNATGVATATSVTSIFSEAMDAASINSSTFELRGPAPGNTLVPAAVSYDAGTRTATLTPNAALAESTTYTATVRGGATDPRVKDAAGNALAANASWSFTTAAAGTPSCQGVTSIWPTNPTPSTITDPDTSGVELGVKFQSTAEGAICGIRFYRGPNNPGPHVGSLWNAATGQLLAQASFTNETSGWQQAAFANPVMITANTMYVASYYAPAGGYSVNDNYFTTAVNSGPLVAPSSADSGGNGVYRYGAGGVVPTSSFNNGNYWVDVLFTTNTGPDNTPPTVTPALPAANGTGVNPASPVTALFSEAMDPATVTAVTFELRDAANAVVPATVTYSASTHIGTLTPSASLAPNTQHTVTVLGGSAGVKDLAGNAMAANTSWSFTTGVDPCSAGGNSIVCENSKPGSQPVEWDVTGAGDSSIQGFATDISVNRGGTVAFKVDTPSTDYRIDIYRLGYYGGTGARKVATVQPSATLPQTQPDCLSDAGTGLIDCGNWAQSASWQVPAAGAVPADPTLGMSGIYVAKLVREDGANAGKASHIVFVVREDSSTSDILFQTSDTTWHAYNTYGGNSLYVGSPAGRAYKVSYNRPFITRSVENGQDWLFNAEYPMVRWLEANGYDVTYSTGVDSDRRGNLITNHRAFLSVGHDEYWSHQQRLNVEAARDAGVHLSFFSGNEVFWKTRWENSLDGSATAHRTLVCYKETHANAKIDPTAFWTGTWRDPRFSPPADGGRPENGFTGTIFTVNAPASPSDAIKVPEPEGKLRFWRNTSVANLAPGAVATLTAGTLGYEWDEDLDNGARPKGLIRMSTATYSGVDLLQDFGSNYASGTATHRLTLYRHNSGSLVFGAGTVQWSWGLDSHHDRGSASPDVSMQQATVNLFADMGLQPATLQTGLVAATASSDVTPPTSVITSPAAGATVQPGSTVTIAGTATDSGGGVVGGVEISGDGGASWHPATGRGAWTYAWTAPAASGSVTIRTRAADDSGNVEAPGAGITVSVGSGSDVTPPSAPTGLLATAAAATQVNLVWTASTDNVGVTGYRVERCQGAGCSNFAEIGTSAATSFADTSLTEGTTYLYRVRAQDAAGNFSAYSTVVSAIPDATAPTAPTGLTASAASGTQISLGWTASTDNVGVTSYRVERCQGSGCSSFAQVGTATVPNFTDTGLTGGTIYSYRVRAADAASNLSPYSNIATTTTSSVPVAVGDTFLYRANVLRTVVAPGVLANDTQLVSGPLTAQLVTGSLSGGGTLNFATDGSFTYLRTSNSNTVSFRYRASNGTTLSEPSTGSTVNLRVDAAPTTVGDNCSYDRSANTVTQPTRCAVTGTRVVRMNVVLNDTDSNVTTNVPSDGIGKTVVPATMRVTVAGVGVVVAQNTACGQSAIGLLGTNASIVNNCDGTLTVTMTAINTSNITYSYVVSDDLGAQSSARAVTLSSVP